MGQKNENSHLPPQHVKDEGQGWEEKPAEVLDRRPTPALKVGGSSCCCGEGSRCCLPSHLSSRYTGRTDGLVQGWPRQYSLPLCPELAQEWTASPQAWICKLGVFALSFLLVGCKRESWAACCQEVCNGRYLSLHTCYILVDPRYYHIFKTIYNLGLKRSENEKDKCTELQVTLSCFSLLMLRRPVLCV